MISLNPESHIYSDETGREFTSVSRVISTVIAKSFEGVDPAVLANAAERGRRVEDYATEILKTGGCSIAAGEREDVVERVGGFWRWCEEAKPELIEAQKIVTDGELIAGSLDYAMLIGAGDYIVDLKCTASPEPSWALQIGAYVEMYPKRPNYQPGCAVLHLNPKYKNGWIWREYDPMIVRSQWASALAWYRTLQTLKVKP
jgi:hypothetical protein